MQGIRTPHLWILRIGPFPDSHPPRSPVALQSMVLLCKALSTLTFPTLVVFSLGGFDARCATSGTSGMQTPQHQVSYFTTAFCGELVPNLKIVAVFGGYPKHEGPQSRSDPTRVCNCDKLPYNPGYLSRQRSGLKTPAAKSALKP